MTITTMESLEALPIGTSIRVSGRRTGNKMFTRSADGFDIDGVTIPLEMFAGHVKAGQVVNYATGDPEAGDHFESGRYRYIVLAVQDHTVTLMQFVNGEYRQTLQRSLDDCRTYAWRRQAPDQRPPWHDSAYALGLALSVATSQATDYAQQLSEEQVRVRDLTRDLTRMRESRAAQIQVVATGVTRLPLEKADGHVPVDVSVVDVVASWRREFTVTTEPVSGCQCGVVSREQVAGMLGVTVNSDFGYEVNCGRH